MAINGVAPEKFIEVKQRQNVKVERFMLVDSKENKMKQPNIAVEVFLSLVKYFLLFIILNNLIWAGIHFSYVAKSFSGTAMEVMQDGTNNNQSVKNG